MNALDFASDLITFDSVSTNSNSDISDYIQRALQSQGFDTETISYEIDGVKKVNVIAKRGSGSGGVAYFGHTDVVPADDWSIDDHGPFQPTVYESRLYGRGATDMKGSVACMLAATAKQTQRSQTHPVYVCCSADEELDHRGIKEVIARSGIYRELVDGNAAGVVGEPTGMNVVYAHKGGVQIVVTSRGKAAHSSTNEGVNANWAMIPFLQEMKWLHEATQREPKWLDCEFDPPNICLNIGVNDHTKAVNITAPQSICTLCFRSMPQTDVGMLVDQIRTAAENAGLSFDLISQNSPFRRDPGAAFTTACTSICDGKSPKTVAFGTEAGNLIDLDQLIVLGPGDIAQAHKSDEWISLDQLDKAVTCYQRILESFCF